jgi:hypothetical protein
MTLVVADSIVGKFLCGQQYPTGSQVDPVYPPGFIASICGGPLCGDGHVCFGVPSGQFGTPTFTVSISQSRSVTGIGSAQSFGTLTVKAVFLCPVTGLGSAQQFGTVQFRVSAPAGGVTSAQQFGVPVASARFTLAIGSVSSAQQFGTISVKAVLVRTVGAVATAQQFGTPTTRSTAASGGVNTAQQFGVPKLAIRFTLAGLSTAQQFGTIAVSGAGKTSVFGVPTAQSFGALTVRVSAVTRPALGVPSAQAFGLPTYKTTVTVSLGGIASAQAFGTVAVRVAGTAVTGVPSAQLFGTPTASIAVHYLHVVDCVASPLPALCGTPICGDGTVCGGDSFTEQSWCLEAPYGSTIAGTFTCGQRLVGSTFPTEVAA